MNCFCRKHSKRCDGEEKGGRNHALKRPHDFSFSTHFGQIAVYQVFNGVREFRHRFEKKIVEASLINTY